VDVPLYALLVGVAGYPHPSLTRLHGPLNDVADLRSALVDDLGVAAEHVRTLTDGEATRAGIEAAFRDHLHRAGQEWRRSGGDGPPPAFLFAFSGHGSQARDDTGRESDGFNETLVPYDGRDTDVYDIKDHELADWLAELPGDNITVVLDCCHSGSGSRFGALTLGEVPDEVPDDAVRSVPPDLRPQPPIPAPATPPTLGGVRGVSLAGTGSHVLVAACRDHEEAFEYRGDDGVVRGALTSFLVPALVGSVGRPGTTYRGLHQLVRFDVNRVRPRQTPVCEGDLDREVFSSRHVEPEPGAVAHVIGRRDGQVWLDVGQAHGITPATRLDVAGGQVVVGHLETARCAGPFETVGDDLPARGAPARLAGLDLGDARWRVWLAPEVRPDLRQALAAPPLSGLVGPTDDLADADLRIRQDDGPVLLDAEDAEVVRHDDPSGFAATVAHVAHVAHLLDGGTADPGPTLRGTLGLRVRRAREDPVTGELVVEDPPTDGHGVAVTTAGDRVVVEVTNGAQVPVYLGLTVVTAGWEVALLHPPVPGAEDQVAARSTYRVGLGKDAFTAFVPVGQETTTDLVRAVVSTEPAAFDALALNPPDATWQPVRPLPPPPSGRGRGGTSAPPLRGRWVATWVPLVTVRP
jgi:hypothetical protein